MVDEDRRPILETKATWVKRGFPSGFYWKLETVGCPYCKKKSHQHGGGSKDVPSGGHRNSHCVHPLTDDSRGYVLVVVEITNPEYHTATAKDQEAKRGVPI
ncbi:MAG: hypothetical protein ACRYFS_24500 [Janthinobacterium lividum]